MRKFALLVAVAGFPAWAEVPRVMTDLPPVHSLAASVMAGLGQPGLLVAQGADGHDFQLRPSQAAELARADVVFWVGEEMTPWLARIVGPRGDDAVALIEAPGLQEREPMFGGEDDHHGHDHGHDHDHDPHVWLDPENAKAILDLMVAELSRRDPGNAATYAGNAEAAKGEIDRAAAAAAAMLDPHAGARLVVGHDAYAHFAARFGVTIIGAVSQGDATAPGAASLAALRARIAEEGAHCVFAEAQSPDRLARSLAADTGLPLGLLDPAGSTLTPGPGLYPALIEGLARSIVECLSNRR